MTGQKELPPDLSVLSPWARELAATFVTLSNDIALVMDEGGVIRNVALGGNDPISANAAGWVGQSWIDTVTGDTRRKIEQLLQEVATTGVARRREVNHRSEAGYDVPVAYTAIRLGADGPVLAVGRDLRAVAAIQQRFLDTQRELEQDYWKRRQAETRYRVLFQVATDGVVVVDAGTLQILEANRAAAELFDLSPETLAGRYASFGFERHSRAAVEELLVTARAVARPAEIRAMLAGRKTPVHVSATPFRAEDAVLLLMRLRIADSAGQDARSTLAQFVERTHDGVVVTDPSGRIQFVNPAFLQTTGLPDETHVKGRQLEHWLGDAADLPAMLAQVRRTGLADRSAVSLRTPDGMVHAVDVAAVLLDDGDQELVGFTIRGHGRIGTAAVAESGDELVETLQRLATRVGTLGLPGLIRQATDAAERHFIRLALERARGQRGAAAEALGVSPGELDQRLRDLQVPSDRVDDDQSPPQASN